MSDNKADPLLPCPFCGKPGSICCLEDEPGDPIGFWVSCSCGSETNERRTEDEARVLWNTRAALAAPQPAAPLGGREAVALTIQNFAASILAIEDDEIVNVGPFSFACAHAILAAIPQERGVEREAREECLRRGIDPDDICADGGVTAWMVVYQETREGGRHPIEILWRKHDLPEWFLGNGGTNTKLYALYDAIRALAGKETGQQSHKGIF